MKRELTELEFRLQEIISKAMSDPLDKAAKSFLKESLSNVDWKNVLSDVMLDPLGEALEGLKRDVFPDAEDLEYTISETEYNKKMIEVYKMLRNETRRYILFHLVNKDATFSELKAESNVSNQNFYKHLNKLLYSGLVTRSAKESYTFTYSISPSIRPLIADLEYIETYIENIKLSVKKRLPELNQLLENKRADSSPKASAAL